MYVLKSELEQSLNHESQVEATINPSVDHYIVRARNSIFLGPIRESWLF